MGALGTLAGSTGTVAAIPRVMLVRTAHDVTRQAREVDGALAKLTPPERPMDVEVSRPQPWSLRRLRAMLEFRSLRAG